MKCFILLLNVIIPVFLLFHRSNHLISVTRTNRKTSPGFAESLFNFLKSSTVCSPTLLTLPVLHWSVNSSSLNPRLLCEWLVSLKGLNILNNSWNFNSNIFWCQDLDYRFTISSKRLKYNNNTTKRMLKNKCTKLNIIR